MVAEWSVECSMEDPVLVVPWTVAEAGGKQSDSAGDFVDLRENPYDLDQIPEAERHPPLMQALRALNAPRSAVFTAKCDVWELQPEELEQVRTQLDLADDALDSSRTGFASYIDLVWRERSIFASFHQSEQLLHRLERLAAAIDAPSAVLDCVLRPAMIDLNGPREGFALSVYVKAVGPDLHAAKATWSDALDAVVGLLRSKDVSLG